jgi:hypothetical protein
MGEKQNQPFQLSFNPCLKVDFQGSRVTSDGGLLLVRELDERLGLSALIAANVGFGIKTCRRGSTTPGAPGKEQSHGRSKAGPQQAGSEQAESE